MRFLTAGCLGVVLVTAFGCSRFPKAPGKPNLNPDQSAQKALDEYDTDQSGAIDKKEIRACPGLWEALKKGKIDKNDDGQLDAAEIAERIKYFKSARSIIVSGEMQVRYRGKPLVDATVTFEPESFLGESFASSSGVTDQQGRASMEGNDAVYPGIYLGFYRVTFSKEKGGKESLPAKYNEETTIGYEATDDDEMVSDIITFDLK